MMEKIDVMHVVPNLLKPGGAERFACTLPGFLKTRYNQVVCVLNDIGEQTKYLPGDIEFKCLGIPSSTIKPLTLNKLVRNLHGMINIYKPRIIHSHLWPAFRASALAGTGTDVKHICLVQDTRLWLKERGIRNSAVRMLTNHCLRSCNPTMIAVSSDAAEYTARYLDVKRNVIDVIYNAVDTSEFHPSQESKEREGKFVFGTASNFRPGKGHSVLIEAAAILKEKGYDFEVHLAGSGGQEKNIMRQLEERNLQGEFILKGLLTNMRDFYLNCDAFVLPSEHGEGLPLSLLEAMAMRLPIITTSIAGANEAIEHGKQGIIVPPGDSRTLADAMEKFIKDRNMASSMGIEAENKAQNVFSFNVISDQYSKLYDKIINGK
jgi:glycosyltransferase involved in cell wall biosynthesis